MSGRRVAVGGLPFFGRMLAGMLNGDGWRADYVQSLPPPLWAPFTALRQIAAADLVYLVGGQLERWSRPDWLRRTFRGPVIMHWTGSDVLFARDALKRGRGSRRLIESVQHWAEVPWIAEELHDLGIDAGVVPLTSAQIMSQPIALPDEFTVLAYLPSGRWTFYGREHVLSMARALPEVRFLIVGTDQRTGATPPNIEMLGWRADMDSIYRCSTVLVRQPEHDGLSFMVLEMLAAGRYVIWNHPLDGAIEASTPEAGLAALRLLLAQHRAGTLDINEGGLVSVRTTYSPDRVKTQLLARFASLLGEGR